MGFPLPNDAAPWDEQRYASYERAETNGGPVAEAEEPPGAALAAKGKHQGEDATAPDTQTDCP